MARTPAPIARTRTRAFEGLGNPTRLRIVELLAKGERTAGQLAEAFEVTRPAVSRHLRVLRDAGIVEWRSRRQERVYRLNPDVLDDLGRWLERMRTRWSRAVEKESA